MSDIRYVLSHQPFIYFNPLETNGISHSYHLEESTFIVRGIRGSFSFLFHFSMKIKIANRIAPDGTPRFVASHLGLFCFTMSHKKDARLLMVKHLHVWSSPLALSDSKFRRRKLFT